MRMEVIVIGRFNNYFNRLLFYCFNRAAMPRCTLSDKLRNMGYHVFAIDYRGILKA
jgi:hypothetical protein